MTPQAHENEQTSNAAHAPTQDAPLQLTEADLGRPDGGMPVKTGLKAGDLTIKQKITEGP